MMVDTVRTLSLAVFALLAPLHDHAIAKEEEKQDDNPRPGKEDARRDGSAMASLEGLKISYSPRRVYTKKVLNARKYDSAVEIDAIVRSRAIVETTRPISYRTTVLAPGRYELRIQRDGSKYHFVIGAVKTKAKGNAATAKKAAMGVAGDMREESQKKIRSSAEVEDEKREKGKGSTKAPTIRAPFLLRKNPRPTASTAFELRPSRDKQKFALTVRAGSSVGRANLTFATPQRRK